MHNIRTTAQWSSASPSNLDAPGPCEHGRRQCHRLLESGRGANLRDNVNRPTWEGRVERHLLDHWQYLRGSTSSGMLSAMLAVAPAQVGEARARPVVRACTKKGVNGTLSLNLRCPSVRVCQRARSSRLRIEVLYYRISMRGATSTAFAPLNGLGADVNVVRFRSAPSLGNQLMRYEGAWGGLEVISQGEGGDNQTSRALIFSPDNDFPPSPPAATTTSIDFRPEGSDTVTGLVTKVVNSFRSASGGVDGPSYERLSTRVTVMTLFNLST
ncbi:hypothetical protein EVAR_46550_1 [Eumeta japonica]|uniref:Uncharacterized protein n=1 Tax=Eumeta variegata TaxID=151549 RepID=A0A4C1XLH2_EUMVA|nr:hypothetical protein EVAR_46550_1 [Eumeta japonica]